MTVAAETKRKTGNELGLSDRDIITWTFQWPELYELAKTLPAPDRSRGGAPRQYPDFLFLGFAMLAAHFGSARKAATELSHPDTWEDVRETVRTSCPDESQSELPASAPSRTWYVKRRDALLFGHDSALEEFLDSFRAKAISLHGSMRANNGEVRGSLTHPKRSDLIEADGKVLAAPYKAPRGTTRRVTVTDPVTSVTRIEERPVRFDPDAREHTNGAGKVVRGNKFLFLSGRGERLHERVIIDVAHVPDIKGHNNSECDIATEAIIRAGKAGVDATAVVTDGVLRGTHIHRIQRETKLFAINPVQAHRIDNTTKTRIEKEGPIGLQAVRFPDGRTADVELWYRCGRVCQRVINADGDPCLVPLDRCTVRRRRNADGTYRLYVDFEVPHPTGGDPGCITVNMAVDPENVRVIPPDDPDYKTLYGRRQDTESINSCLDDHHHLRRARSVGARRQLFDLLAFAMRVNCITYSMYLAGEPPSEVEAA